VDKIVNSETLRMIFAPLTSVIIAMLTSTSGFIFALAIAFSFNIWCGTRVDGVSIKRCKNFSFSKFKNALFEMFLFISIIYIISLMMFSMGDREESLIITKSITYIFIYAYTMNSFKNLVKAYPKNKAIRIIYHLVRLEFMRALPSRVQAVIDRVEKEIK